MTQPTPNIIDWQTQLPWLQIPRAITLAMNPMKIILGAGAVLVLQQSNRALLWLFGIGSGAAGELRYGQPFGSDWWANFKVIAGRFNPWDDVAEPLRAMQRSPLDWNGLAFVVTSLLLALVVWGLIGGMLARQTAVAFAKKKRMTSKAALNLAQRQLMSYLIAPLLPLAGAGVLSIAGVLCGAITGVAPEAGGYLLGAVWGLLLIIGLAMAVLINVVIFGWPLMVVAISTEDSDGFDGLSRAYGLVLDRPVYAILLTVGAFWLGLSAQAAVGYLFEHAAQLVQQTVMFGGATYQRNEMIDFWMSGWRLLAAGYGVSYFWSAWTAIYMLLRHADDGTPLTTVVGAE